MLLRVKGIVPVVVRGGRCGPSVGSPRSNFERLPSTLDEVATRGYFHDMRTIGIKLLKDKLSEYVRIAGTGETILVTDRDRVVAELGPPRAGRAEQVSDAVVAEGVRAGWITPRRYAADIPIHVAISRRPIAEVLSDLDRDREDR